MRNFLLIIILSLLNLGSTFGQATDFVTNDCSGTSHHLFSELDAGDVIVIAWVMPCLPCATYSIPAYSAVQSFAISHPGRVQFYMADDFANTPCSSLINWGNGNNMPNSTFFSSANVNMNGYGIAGMPKVVVLGGANHTIYLNQNDVNITFNNVQAAISDALGTFSGVNEQQKRNFELISFPNPSNDLLNITYKISQLEDITFEIINSLGKTVFSVKKESISTIGTYKESLDISRLESGMYFLNVSSTSNTETLKFVVSH